MPVDGDGGHVREAARVGVVGVGPEGGRRGRLHRHLRLQLHVVQVPGVVALRLREQQELDVERNHAALEISSNGHEVL